jgi:hypothetical protein
LTSGTGLTLMPECQCRNADAGLKKLTAGKNADAGLAFLRHSGIYIGFFNIIQH